MRAPKTDGQASMFRRVMIRSSSLRPSIERSFLLRMFAFCFSNPASRMVELSRKSFHRASWICVASSSWISYSFEAMALMTSTGIMMTVEIIRGYTGATEEPSTMDVMS